MTDGITPDQAHALITRCPPDVQQKLQRMDWPSVLHDLTTYQGLSAKVTAAESAYQTLCEQHRMEEHRDRTALTQAREAWEAEAGEARTKLTAREQAVANREALVAARLRDLATIDEKAESLKQASRALETQRLTVVAERSALTKTQQALVAQQGDLTRQAHTLEVRQARLEEATRKLQGDQLALGRAKAEWEADVATARATLAQAEESRKAIESYVALKAEATALLTQAQRERAAVAEQAATVAAQGNALETLRAAFDQRQAALTQRETALAAREQDVKHRELVSGLDAKKPAGKTTRR